MGYSLACPICEERVYGREFRDTDIQLITHMNQAHPIVKRKKHEPPPNATILPDLDIEGLEEPW